MDRYLLNDILKERSYLEWKTLINQLNQEYHDKLYYGEREYGLGVINYECLRCRKCRNMLWNWREVGSGICHVHYKHNRFEWRYLGIDLPKNY